MGGCGSKSSTYAGEKAVSAQVLDALDGMLAALAGHPMAQQMHLARMISLRCECRRADAPPFQPRGMMCA